MQKNARHIDGFSLVELLVVITIIALMSAGTVVGFGRLNDSLSSKQAGGYLTDLVDQTTLRVLNKQYESAVITFLPDYVVIEADTPDADLDLSLGGSCDADDYALNVDDGNLLKKDEDGALIEIQPVTAGAPVCVNFQDSPERIWEYQITQGEQKSGLVRFIHFNLNRDNTSNPLQITSGDGNSVLVRGPYGNKVFTPADGFDLTLEDASGEISETISIQ